MGRIEDLAVEYERHIRTPWQRTLAGAQRVIMVVYEKELERAFRARKAEFEQRSRSAGYGWRECDLTTAFSAWMAEDEYRDAYFECPDDLRLKLESEFQPRIAQMISSHLNASDDRTIVAVTGAASIFGFARLSDAVRAVEPDIRGRLAVFFPGHKDGNNYRMLDARDGWNYLAVGITVQPAGASA